MELFWKAAALMLVTVILGLAVGKKEFTLLMTMAACCFGAMAAVHFLQPILELLRKVESAADLTDGVLGVLLKCTGIGMTAELAELICKDAGSSSLGKMIQILSGTVIGYLSIPVITSLFDLLQEILGAL